MKWYKGLFEVLHAKKNIEKQYLPCLHTNILHKQSQAKHILRMVSLQVVNLDKYYWPYIKNITEWQKSVNKQMF